MSAEARPSVLVTRYSALLLLCLTLAGCTPPQGMRKITAWGIWAVAFGAPIGIGYWHSEHGAGVESEQSAKPPQPKEIVPSAE